MQEGILDIINQWDEKSLAALYRHFYKVTVSYAFKIVGEQMIAEDVVQDVFLNMWETKKIFNSTGHLRTFIIQCIHNRCIDKLRTAKRNVNREREVSLMSDAIVRPNDDDILQEEVYQNLLFAIDALPTRQRDIFLLLMEGKTNAEIAVSLQISQNTVKSHRKKGLSNLKKKLNPKSLSLLYAILAFT